MANIAQLMALPDVDFVNTSVNDLLAMAITTYQNTFLEQTGQPITLQPGDDEYIMLYTNALIAYSQLQSINYAAKQNLLKYSTGNNLKQLGANTGNVVSTPQPAVTALTFTLGAIQSVDIPIAQGKRATPGNGLYFATNQAVIIPAGSMSVTTLATCTVPGSVGNGYIPGMINIMADSIPFVASVTNTQKTAGGSDVQSDESFREQIFSGNQGFTVAGPSSAYDYFARLYSSSVIDTKVVSPSPNVINQYVLLTGGALPNEAFLNGLMDFIGADDKRPMTDMYSALAPAVYNYTIEFVYYIDEDDADQSDTIQIAVLAAVEAFKLWSQSKINRDINPDQLTFLVKQAGAKRLVISSPTYTTITGETIATPTTSTVTYGGLDES